MKILCLTPIKHLPGVFEKLANFSEVIYEPDISKDKLRNLLRKTNNIDALFVNPNKQSYKLDRDLLVDSSIKLINTASTGIDHIDVSACEDLGIQVVSLTNDYELIQTLPSTSELAFGLMLSLLRHIPQSANNVKKGKWDYTNFIGRQVKGLTAGIIGYGRLGRFMAKYCDAFGMQVVICDPYEEDCNYHKVSLKHLAQECDVISLHVHLTSETHRLINATFLSQTTKKPYVINTSRGAIVDEQAVIDAIKNGIIAGYGADVIDDEFGQHRHSLILQAAKDGLPILVTPHIGGMTWEGQTRAYSWAIDKFKDINR